MKEFIRYVDLSAIKPSDVAFLIEALRENHATLRMLAEGNADIGDVIADLHEEEEVLARIDAAVAVTPINGVTN